MKREWGSAAMLVLTAMIWGAAFVAQSAGMDYVRPMTFLAVRSALAALALLPLALLRRRSCRGQWKPLLRAGILCGAILWAATALQQYGLLYTTAGKSGFLTALYVVLVPVGSRLLGQRVGRSVWVGVGLAAVSLYLLCMDGSGFSMGPGELLTLGCAVGFALHILAVGRLTGEVDGVLLSCVQFVVCVVLSLPGTLLWERPEPRAVLACWLPMVYAGVLSSGVGYTLQILGQRRVRATVASLLLSMESLFAVVFGALLLHERLSLREYAGCALMLAAVVLAQLPQKEASAAGDSVVN